MKDTCSSAGLVLPCLVKSVAACGVDASHAMTLVLRSEVCTAAYRHNLSIWLPDSLVDVFSIAQTDADLIVQGWQGVECMLPAVVQEFVVSCRAPVLISISGLLPPAAVLVVPR